jgi:Xaa-Pro dipeptidase
MRQGNPLLLEEGITYTIEPGIYLTSRNGVRIEDDMVVTATGSESLSDLPRELFSVG